MPSLPLTPQEEKKILSQLGLSQPEDLFFTVPPKIRDNADFQLDFGHGTDGKRGLTEHELRTYFGHLASKNGADYTHFVGGGIYDNIIPAIVNQLILRGEFLTCYTPYQPEISQGTLQAIFEFQTMICRITGMEVANASMYDGATATAEAILMAERLSTGSDRKIPLIADSLNPEWKTIANTFLRGHSEVPVMVPWNEHGTIDLTALKKLLAEKKPYAFVVPYPNYFGIIEPLDEIRALLPKECSLVVAVQDLSALSIFEPPGSFGADIVAGEAQQLGTPMSFGGPHVGFFATQKNYLRQMPGRLCGESVDAKGNRAFTLTLSTREQHIRREKATSNICTNQGLIALRTAIYLSFLGKQGFQNLGEMNLSLFDYLLTELESRGVRPLFKKSLHYREGVFEVPNLNRRFEKALQNQIIPGIPLVKKYPLASDTWNDALLISVHPKHQKSDIDALVEVLSCD